MDKPTVFISYAHKDGMEFTRRFAFALGLYADVFWDRRLPAGEFEPHLLNEITNRDFFIFIMTPHALRVRSYCRKEITHVQEVKPSSSLIIAKLLPDTRNKFEQELSKYTWADFTVDFEQGFRRITDQLFRQPFSSWESLPALNDKDLLKCLEDGSVPGVIAKEVVEWVIVRRLWRLLQEYSEKQQSLLFWGEPSTLVGVVRQSGLLLKQFARQGDGIGAHITSSISKTVEPLITNMATLHDEEHQRLGKLAYETIQAVRAILNQASVGAGDIKSASYVSYGYFDFEVAEKLRELITIHARRSRYLY